MNLYIAGETVKLVAQLEDGAETFYPRATVYRGNSLDSEIDLAHVAMGRYSGDWVPGATDIYHVIYQVFSDAARTTEYTEYGRQVEPWQAMENLSPPIADAVLSEQLSDHSGVAGSLAEAVEALEARLTVARAAALDSIAGIVTDVSLSRKIMKNRLELAEGATGNWILYDDDQLTPLITWDVSDKDGQAVRIASYVPARRDPQ